MVNKFAGSCSKCGARVAPKAGKLERVGSAWVVSHLACSVSGQAEVIEIRTSGATITRNRRGTCEDAPCCGCCGTSESAGSYLSYEDNDR